MSRVTARSGRFFGRGKLAYMLMLLLLMNDLDADLGITFRFFPGGEDSPP